MAKLPLQAQTEVARDYSDAQAMEMQELEIANAVRDELLEMHKELKDLLLRKS